MTDTYVVAAEGLSELRATVEALPENIKRAAFRATRKSSDFAVAESRRQVRQQVAFPARYLSESDSSGKPRLGITRQPTPDRPEATITGRFRATSLARFAQGNPQPGKRGGTIRLQVAPGVTRSSQRIFAIKLRAGTASVDSKFNIGLAIRLREGESIQNKKRMIRLSRNLYLLYGPSVDQVFRTVRQDVGPEAIVRLEREFLRLLELDLS